MLPGGNARVLAEVLLKGVQKVLKDAKRTFLEHVGVLDGRSSSVACSADGDNGGEVLDLDHLED